MEALSQKLRDEYTIYGKKLERALEAVRAKDVKCHIFQPSGREIWTVLGREGDQMVDDTQPYCSCKHFYYRVLGNRDLTCYHLLSLKLAKKLKTYDKIFFQDEEYHLFLKALIRDLYPILYIDQKIGF